MRSTLMIFNTSTMGSDDIQVIIDLIGVEEANLDNEITTNASEGVKEFLNLIRAYNNHGEILFDKFTVKPSNEKKKIEDVPDIKNEIRFVYDEPNAEWYVVAQTPMGQRYQKRISDITPAEAQESFLAGLNILKLRKLLENKSSINYTEYDTLKKVCFPHANPKFKIGDLLKSSLDDKCVDTQKIRDIREYIKAKAKSNYNITLIIYSNGTNIREVCGKNAEQYVLDSINCELKKVGKRRAYNVIYLGGGHGWPSFIHRGMLSGLHSASINSIVDLLRNAGVTFNSIILGSCFSASYANIFSTLLTDNGVMLSSTISQGESNFFKNTVEIIINKKNTNDFFENIDVVDSTKPTGICITQYGKHSGLKLGRRTTGLPEHCADDEYKLSDQIIKHISSSSCQFSACLDDCNDQKQKSKFNTLIKSSITQNKSLIEQQEPLAISNSRYGFWCKVGLGLCVVAAIGVAAIHSKNRN